MSQVSANSHTQVLCDLCDLPRSEPACIRRRNMRLRDQAEGRGLKAKKQGEPKEYPLHKGDWSHHVSCDESSDGESSQDAVSTTMGF